MNAVIEGFTARATPAEREWLFLEVPAQADQARRLRHALADFVRRQGWSEDDVDIMTLAVGEACNNAVSYSPPDTMVSLCAELLNRNHLQVEIRNPAGDTAQIPRHLRDLPADDSIHGRGFPLMSRLMDEVSVGREGDMVVVRLIKRLPV